MSLAIVSCADDVAPQSHQATISATPVATIAIADTPRTAAPASPSETPTPVALTMADSFVLRGRVLDAATLRGLSDQRVFARPAHVALCTTTLRATDAVAYAITASDGSYELNVPPGEYRLLVVAQPVEGRLPQTGWWGNSSLTSPLDQSCRAAKVLTAIANAAGIDIALTFTVAVATAAPVQTATGTTPPTIRSAEPSPSGIAVPVTCRQWPAFAATLLAKLPVSADLCLQTIVPRPQICGEPLAGCYIAAGPYFGGFVVSRNFVWVSADDPHVLAHEMCHAHQHQETAAVGLPSWSMWAANFIGLPPTRTGFDFAQAWSRFKSEDAQGFAAWGSEGWTQDRGQDFENAAEVCASWFSPVGPHDTSRYPLLAAWAAKWLPPR